MNSYRFVAVFVAVLCVGCAANSQLDTTSVVSNSTTATTRMPPTTSLTPTTPTAPATTIATSTTTSSLHAATTSVQTNPTNITAATTATAAATAATTTTATTTTTTLSPRSDHNETTEVAVANPSSSAVLLRLLEALPIEVEQRSGYDRSLFVLWVDADGDRCDTRREVLIAEAIVAPQVSAGCALSGGQWQSIYDGRSETGNGSGFDVDHLVPLAEAWDSGAHSWDSVTRRNFANDLSYEHTLVAVSASSNRQKGARDPAEWLPADRSVHCWYASAWIAVKTRWRLSVDANEARALRQIVAQCDDYQLGTTPQPAVLVIATPSTTTATSTAVAAEPSSADDLCHPAYIPCLPNLPGDAVNCGDLESGQKPVQVREIGVDPYRLDRDKNGVGCTS